MEKSVGVGPRAARALAGGLAHCLLSRLFLSWPVPCPRRRVAGVLTVAMVNEHGQYFEDAIAVTFNEGFEQVLKWVALMPFAAAVAAVVVASVARRAPLPYE